MTVKIKHRLTVCFSSCRTKIEEPLRYCPLSMSLERGSIIGVPYYCKKRDRFLWGKNRIIAIFPARIVAVSRGQDAVIVKYLDRRPPYPVAVTLNAGLVWYEDSETPEEGCLCKDFYKLISKAPPYYSALARLSDQKCMNVNQLKKPSLVRHVGPRRTGQSVSELDTSREMGEHWFQLGQRALRFQV